MIAPSVSKLLAFAVCLALAVPAAATSIADYTATLDRSSLTATVGGEPISWLSPASYAHFHADDVPGFPYTIVSSEVVYVSQWGPAGATGGIPNGTGGAVVNSDTLMADIWAQADFTTTDYMSVSSIASRWGYYNPIDNPGAVAISIDYALAGSASTELPGDYVSLVNSHVEVWADIGQTDCAEENRVERA